jgi:7-keto-8-aminopelargonate synthetase-like enzyme
VSLDDRLRRRLDDLRARGLERRLPRIEARVGHRYRLDGQPVVGFCSNDYLGLASDPILAGADDPPHNGASASRLICGDLPIHRDVEQRLAAFVGTDDAVLFPSGFQLNVGVLPALLDPTDHVGSDALNHASLIDGLRLAKARARILPHTRPPEPAPAGSRSMSWWITESLFSMDGDRIEPADVAAHLAAGGCAYIDEAHALGLYGDGQALLRSAGVTPTVLVGTLSKAFGCAGAFLAASATVCTWIRTRARSFVFSTGVAPPIAARIERALEVVRSPDGDARRARLWANAGRLAAALRVDAPPSPIFPLLVGDNEAVVSLAAALAADGYHVQAIRPPTVPAGTSRLRITVTAAHTPEQIDGLVAAIFTAFDRHDRPLVVERGRIDPLPS